MNIKFYLLFILGLTGISLAGQAQISYNKRAMGAIGAAPKVGDFLNNAGLDQVDMATGALKVGIPLYEIKVNDISVPISINYTATGLKVRQEAGPVGMGWELVAGGKIITNVQGRPDGSGDTHLYTENWATALASNPGSLNPYTTHRSLVADMVDGKKDGAWDTYSYILPNGGGTYVKNGLTFPYDPQITIQHPGVIKTTDGLIYKFTSGDTRQSKKRTYYEPGTPDPTYIGDATFTREPKTTSWSDYDLTQIISTRFQDTVFFNYQQITSPSILASKTRIYTSESVPLYRNMAQLKNGNGVPQGFLELNPKFYDIQQPIISQSKTEFTNHTRLRKISFPNGDARFIYGSDVLGRDVLTEIYIYQKIRNDSTLLKKYEFIYDETDITLYGHYLKNIHVYDGKNVKTGTWSFTYDGKLPLDPTKESMAQDRWGFFNNVTGNKTLIEDPSQNLIFRMKQYLPIQVDQYNTSKAIEYTRPEATEYYGLINGSLGGNNIYTYTIPFANRNFVAGWAQKGILKSVKMPTGGQYEYEYEAHKFRKYVYIGGSSVSQSFEGGGLRIKSITKKMGHDSLYSYSTPMLTAKKNFTYGEGNYLTSGHPDESNGFGNVTLPGTALGNNHIYINTATGTGRQDLTNIMLLSHPVNNMSQYNGSYAIYKSITESTSTGTGDETFGKTVYYNNIPTQAESSDWTWQPGYGYSSLDNINFPLVHSNPGVEKALLVGTAGIRRYRYKPGTGEDAGYRLVDETQYAYQSFSAPQTPQNKLLSLFATVVAQISGTYTTTPSEMSDHGYEGQWGMSNYNLFNATHNTDNYGIMDYLAMTNLAQEANIPNFEGKYSCQLIDLATLSTCIRKTKEITTTYGTDTYTRSTTETKYDYGNLVHLLPTRIATKNSKLDSVFIRRRYAQDYPSPTYPISNMIAERVGLSEPLEEISTYKIGNGTTEYVKQVTGTDFNFNYNSALNVAGVYEMNIPGQVQLSTLPYYPNIANPTLFKQKIKYNSYNKGNITRYTEETGSASAVIWGYKNQYPIAKITNVDEGAYAPADSVAFTNFESTDKGNWVYAGVPQSDPSSPFGKQIYSLSTGAITKPNSIGASRCIISYWYKSGTIVNITGGTVGPVREKNKRLDWVLVEREISNITSTLTVSGSGYIDELRLYPFEALMTTYNYEPLIGVTSVIDPKGKIQYYEYDDAQRLKNIRDQDGNIVKSYKYILGTSN